VINLGKRKKLNKRIINLILFIAVMSVMFYGAAITVDRIITDYCFETLDDAAAQYARNINREIDRSFEDLKLIESLWRIRSAGYDDVNAQIERLFEQAEIDPFGALMPDGSFYSPESYSFLGKELIYEEEVKKGRYISKVYKTEKGQSFICLAVPVDDICILYGFEDLYELSQSSGVNLYENDRMSYIIDGNTGEIILGVGRDIEFYGRGKLGENVQVANGYSLEKMYEDIKNGKSGHLVCTSKYWEGDCYAAYAPVGVDNWIAMLNVDESIMIARAIQTRKILISLGIALALVFVVNFVWNIFDVHKEVSHSKKRLKSMTEIFGVQQILLEANDTSQLIKEALAEAGRILEAESVLIISVEGNRITEVYGWAENEELAKPDLKRLRVQRAFPDTYPILMKGEAVIYKKGRDSYKEFSADNVNSVIMVPVRDKQNKIIGGFGAVNLAKEDYDLYLLELMARNFLMALNNAKAYEIIKKMGTMDSLTGLQNRNSYQKKLVDPKILEHSSLYCIYMDVNGLHELNNHLGHASGDKMLKFTGSLIISTYGLENSYRIGGDEFVVFCSDVEKQWVKESVENFQKQMSAMGYDISVGVACREGDINAEMLVSQAEMQMYKEKRRYYEQNGNSEKSREMNVKLEKILIEKRDNDNFISIISDYFLGVYVVNIKTDNVRIICGEKCFRDILKAKDCKFLPAVAAYLEGLVLPGEKEALLKLLDYNEVEAVLAKEKRVKRTYSLADGRQIMLRVYRYDGDENETIWLLEERQ